MPGVVGPLPWRLRSAAFSTHRYSIISTASPLPSRSACSFLQPGIPQMGGMIEKCDHLERLRRRPQPFLGRALRDAAAVAATVDAVDTAAARSRRAVAGPA